MLKCNLNFKCTNILRYKKAPPSLIIIRIFPFRWVLVRQRSYFGIYHLEEGWNPTQNERIWKAMQQRKGQLVHCIVSLLFQAEFLSFTLCSFLNSTKIGLHPYHRQLSWGQGRGPLFSDKIVRTHTLKAPLLNQKKMSKILVIFPHIWNQSLPKIITP